MAVNADDAHSITNLLLVEAEDQQQHLCSSVLILLLHIPMTHTRTHICICAPVHHLYMYATAYARAAPQRRCCQKKERKTKEKTFVRSVVDLQTFSIARLQQRSAPRRMAGVGFSTSQ